MSGCERERRCNLLDHLQRRSEQDAPRTLLKRTVGSPGCVHCENSCGWTCRLSKAYTSTSALQLLDRTLEGVAWGDGLEDSRSRFYSCKNNWEHPWGLYLCRCHKRPCWLVKRVTMKELALTCITCRLSAPSRYLSRHQESSFRWRSDWHRRLYYRSGELPQMGRLKDQNRQVRWVHC